MWKIARAWLVLLSSSATGSTKEREKMRHRRRKNLLRGLILAFATGAIVVPTAQARVSSYQAVKTQQERSAFNQLYPPAALRALALRSEAMNQRYQELSVRPDNRAGALGVEATPVISDLTEVQRHMAANQILSQSVATGPDNRAGFRGPGAVEIRTPELVTVKGDGFHWKDASVGAGTAIGITLVLMSGLALSRRRQSELAV
jgi:hypothetical protein